MASVLVVACVDPLQNSKFSLVLQSDSSAAGCGFGWCDFQPFFLFDLEQTKGTVTAVLLLSFDDAANEYGVGGRQTINAIL